MRKTWKLILAILLSIGLIVGISAAAQAGGGWSSKTTLVNNSYSVKAVLTTSTDGVARYLYPGQARASVVSYYVLSGTHVNDSYSQRCYNAGTRVYTPQDNVTRKIRVRWGSC